MSVRRKLHQNMQVMLTTSLIVDGIELPSGAHGVIKEIIDSPYQRRVKLALVQFSPLPGIVPGFTTSIHFDYLLEGTPNADDSAHA